MGAVSSLESTLQTDRLPRAALRSIWAQAKVFLKQPPFALDDSLSLAESFAIVELPNTQLLEYAKPRFYGKWLHLLGNEGRRPMYLLSKPIGPTNADWMLLGVFESDLGDQIKKCLDWARTHTKEVSSVHLLRLTTYHVTALFLTGSKKVIVAAAPKKLRYLKRCKIYAFDEFFNILKDTSIIKSIQVSTEVDPIFEAAIRRS